MKKQGRTMWIAGILLLCFLLPIGALASTTISSDITFEIDMSQVESPISSSSLEIPWTYAVPLYALINPSPLLVNSNNLLDSTFVPSPLIDMTMVKRATSSKVFLQEECANALIDMFEAAKQVTSYTCTLPNSKGKLEEKTYTYENGMTLYLKSGYRSYQTQKTVYSNYLARNNNVDDGYSAKPGSSEHQSGLGVDILNANFANKTRMTQAFANEPEAQWLKENCAQFGFILRYTKEAEAITGISFEPWHFRYVGPEIAGYITANNLTLEDFFNEWEFKFAEFVGQGGDPQKQIIYELSRKNAPPESNILETKSEDGEAEISLRFF